MNSKNALDLNNSIIENGILDISSDLLEAELDTLLEEGFLKNIPIFSIGVKLFKLTENLIEYYNKKKILKFLFELKDIPQGKRQTFVSKLSTQKEYKSTGELILLILSRFDEIGKATIIGKLYKATISEELSLTDFFRLVYIIEKTFLNDLVEMSKFNPPFSPPKNIQLKLYQAGLYDQLIKDKRKDEKFINKYSGSTKFLPPEFIYEINNFGQLMIKYGF